MSVPGDNTAAGAQHLVLQSQILDGRNEIPIHESLTEERTKYRSTWTIVCIVHPVTVFKRARSIAKMIYRHLTRLLLAGSAGREVRRATHVKE